MPKTVTVAGKEYDFESLSPQAQDMANHVAAADGKLAQLRAEIDMIQVARDVYVRNLLEHLPAQPVALAQDAEMADGSETVSNVQPTSKKNVH